MEEGGPRQPQKHANQNNNKARHKEREEKKNNPVTSSVVSSCLPQPDLFRELTAGVGVAVALYGCHIHVIHVVRLLLFGLKEQQAEKQGDKHERQSRRQSLAASSALVPSRSPRLLVRLLLWAKKAPGLLRGRFPPPLRPLRHRPEDADCRDRTAPPLPPRAEHWPPQPAAALWCAPGLSGVHLASSLFSEGRALLLCVPGEREQRRDRQ